MSVVTFLVETADGFLGNAAETQFGAVAGMVGGLMIAGATLVIVVVFVNMAFQARAMDGGEAFWLVVKILLIGIFATNWAQFNWLAGNVIAGIDSLAGTLVASAGGGTPGPSGTFAESFDAMIAEFSGVLNAVSSNLSYLGGAVLNVVGIVLLALLGGLAAFLMIASRLMIALLLGLAPIMIFLTLFEVTKDYFARWASAMISFALFPVIIAGVFATIIGVSKSLIAKVGDPNDAASIGAILPFIMMIFMGKGFLLAVPILTRSISGNIVMPALSGGMGAVQDFGRGAVGNQAAMYRAQNGSGPVSERLGAKAHELTKRGIKSLNAGPAQTGTGEKIKRIADKADRLKGK